MTDIPTESTQDLGGNNVAPFSELRGEEVIGRAVELILNSVTYIRQTPNRERARLLAHQEIAGETVGEFNERTAGIIPAVFDREEIAVANLRLGSDERTSVPYPLRNGGMQFVTITKIMDVEQKEKRQSPPSVRPFRMAVVQHLIDTRGEGVDQWRALLWSPLGYAVKTFDKPFRGPKS
jgi:hypothetical protein